MADCPKTIFEASGTAKDKDAAERKAMENAQKKCTNEAPGCPAVNVQSREEHHNPTDGWTVELRFRCEKGP
jgi:hypothetical protein